MWFHFTRRPRLPAGRPVARLRLEALEDRTLLSIGFTPVLGSIREFSVPTQNAVPDDITPGPDGNVWFTELATNNIGRITRAAA